LNGLIARATVGLRVTSFVSESSSFLGVRDQIVFEDAMVCLLSSKPYPKKGRLCLVSEILAKCCVYISTC